MVMEALGESIGMFTLSWVCNLVLALEWMSYFAKYQDVMSLTGCDRQSGCSTRYLMFPLAIDHQVPNRHRSRPALIASGAILLAIGFIACLIFCVRWQRRRLLRDLIYMYEFFHISSLFCDYVYADIPSELTLCLTRTVLASALASSACSI